MIQWREIPDYEGYYEISSDGQVRSMDRIVRGNKGVEYLRKGVTRKCFPDKYGYLRVYLTKDKDRKHLAIHRLVALTFIPNPEDKPQVNHKNGIKDDNVLENLEWVTLLKITMKYSD